jgi:hypothetical protein
MAAKQKKVLRTDVHVVKPGKGGGWTILKAGQALEAWAEKLIGNEKAYTLADAAEQAPAPKTEPVGGKPDEGAPVDLSTLTFEQLQEQLREHELPADGTQEELVDRLSKFLAEQAAQQQA